jgi:DNA-binding NarL/FixJ family response regulator
MTEDAAAETAGPPIRVLVVEDHTTFAELLTGALEREPDLTSIGYATTVAAGVALFLTSRPEVVVMDYHLPDGNGLDAAGQILARAPDTRIVMLTAYPSADALERAATLGVSAFLPKDGSLATLLQTLRQATPGNMITDPALLAHLTARRAQPSGPSIPDLTHREMDVLRLMAAGSDVRTNARTLGISTSTCRGYTKSVLSKLGAHSQLEAVVTARQRGLLDPQQ